MGIFRRNQPNDVLFLMPVRLANEKLPKSKTRMLYCDAAGKVYASLINRSVYKLARGNAERMERSHKSFATLGLEIGPGKFIPTVVDPIILSMILNFRCPFIKPGIAIHSLY